jgi:preprotein translocase subunit SecF
MSSVRHGKILIRLKEVGENMIEKILSFIPGFDQVKLAIILVAITSLLTVASLGIWQYNKMSKELELKKADNIKLDLAVKEQQQTIDEAIKTIGKWKESQKDFVNNVQAMSETNEAANAAVRSLNEEFAKHDLKSLSSRKPGLVEIYINRGSDNSLRMLECATGSTRKDCPN